MFPKDSKIYLYLKCILIKALYFLFSYMIDFHREYLPDYSKSRQIAYVTRKTATAQLVSNVMMCHKSQWFPAACPYSTLAGSAPCPEAKPDLVHTVDRR